MEHKVKLSHGSGRSYFREDGTRAQVPGLYVVTNYCTCGQQVRAPIEEIEARWAEHVSGGG